MQKNANEKRAKKIESVHEKQDNSDTEKKADKQLTSAVAYLSLSNLNLLDQLESKKLQKRREKKRWAKQARQVDLCIQKTLE